MRMMLGQVHVTSGTIAVIDCWRLGSWDKGGHGTAAKIAGQNGTVGTLENGDIQAIVAGSIPKGTLQIAGERSDDQQHWRYIDLIVRPGGTVATAEEAGRLVVDNARLMFADVDALGKWVHNEPLDGKADVAFWGRDEAEVAQVMDAPKIADNTYGWLDLPVAEAEPLYAQLVDFIDNHGKKMMADYRPHSHHHHILVQMRASPFGVGHVDIDGNMVFGAFTSWGDGEFPALALRDSAGNLVGLRIDLARDGAPDVTATGGTLTATGPLPPDPMTATKNAMSSAATDMAKDYAWKTAVGQMKAVLPSFLHPLIPGQKGTVGGKLQKMVTDYLWETVIGCVISLMFFAVFAVAIGGFLLLILYILLTSMF